MNAVARIDPSGERGGGRSASMSEAHTAGAVLGSGITQPVVTRRG